MIAIVMVRFESVEDAEKFILQHTDETQSTALIALSEPPTTTMQ